MDKAIPAFINYIKRSKGASANTEVSYQRDLKKLADYLQQEKKIDSWDKVTKTDLNSYMLYLEKSDYAASSVCRSVASLRAFFRYMAKRGMIVSDPSDELKPPKVEKKAPAILSIDEVTRLLEAPKTDTPKGMRDKAMLELMYATGMRVSELLAMKTGDIHLDLSYAICRDRSKERVIPFSSSCAKALHLYLEKARETFVHEKDESYLFMNVQGKKMSRQGFWKVLKNYAEEAGISSEITPHTLRHSFATHMLSNGADLKSLQEMMGHSDISSTQFYVNAGLSYMKDVYAKAHPRK